MCHLLVETVGGNLSRGMRQLNGVYTQRFNRRHGLTRYVVLNPVRARMVADPTEWPWSSYRAVVGEAPAPRWLDTDWLLGQFGGERMLAIGAYRQFVLADKDAPSPLHQVRHQMLLGDDAFVVLHQQSRGSDALREVSKAQRRSVALNLPVYRGRYPDRAEAIRNSP